MDYILLRLGLAAERGRQAQDPVWVLRVRAVRVFMWIVMRLPFPEHQHLLREKLSIRLLPCRRRIAEVA